MLTKRLAVAAFAAAVAVSGSLATAQPANARPDDHGNGYANQRYDRDDARGPRDRDDARAHRDRDDRAHQNRNGHTNYGSSHNGNWNGNSWNGNSWNSNGRHDRKRKHHHDPDRDGD